MNKKQKFVVVVTLIVAVIVGLYTGASAADDSLYIPAISNYYIEVEVEYLVCGAPANGVEVYIDAFDGLDKIKLVTDAQGVARWQGNNASNVIYTYSLGEQRYLFQALTKMRVSFQWCEGNLIIIPPPVSS